MGTGLAVLAIVGGLFLLLAAGERLVHHAAHLAASYHVPKVVMGAVIIGFGTSLPELFVSLTAALEGSPGIALGNIVGSNIANVGLILGTGALLTSLRMQRRVIRVDLPFGVLAAIFLLVWVAPQEEVTRLTGGILLAAFTFYLWASMRHTREFRDRTPDVTAEKRARSDVAWIVAGLGGIALGAHLLVQGAAEIAVALGVPPRIIGLSMVAVGTSLPELAAVYVAARKGETDLAVGNIAGSNLFNVLFVLGTTAAVHPIEFEQAPVQRDFTAVAVFGVLAFPLLARQRRISRVQGVVLLAAYCGYILWTWSTR